MGLIRVKTSGHDCGNAQHQAHPVSPQVDGSCLASLLTYLPTGRLCQQWSKDYFSDTRAFAFLHLDRSPDGPPFGSFQNLKYYKQRGAERWAAPGLGCGHRQYWLLPATARTFLANSLLGLAMLSVTLQKVLRNGHLARKEGRRAHRKREEGEAGLWVCLHTGVFICMYVCVCLSWGDPKQYRQALIPLWTRSCISGLMQLFFL